MLHGGIVWFSSPVECFLIQDASPPKAAHIPVSRLFIEVPKVFEQYLNNPIQAAIISRINPSTVNASTWSEVNSVRYFNLRFSPVLH